MEALTLWFLQTRKAQIIQLTLHVGIFYTSNYGFFWAGKISERTIKMVRPVKTLGTKMKSNYFV